MTHSFLLIGQSNMAGRGFLSEAAPLDICGGRLRVLRNGRWQEMFRPVNPDRSWAGTCLAERFAWEYAQANPTVEVGVIPCADGGTSLSQWAPGSLLFDHAVACARLAMRTSRLAGVLWHQGESDCSAEQYPFYQARLAEMMQALRAQLGLPTLPLLLGGLGDFLPNCRQFDHLENYMHVNHALQALAAELPNTAFVSAVGLGANPDNLHFNACALEAFGIRYFEAFKTLDAAATLAAQEGGEDVVRTAMERL